MSDKREAAEQIGAEKYRELKVMKKKFVSQKEGTELYSMGYEMLRKLAEEAGAVYLVSEKKVLINTEIFEEYLETFRVWR